jgi:hypothetical protein
MSADTNDGIPRRDFLNGVLLTGAGLLPSTATPPTISPDDASTATAASATTLTPTATPGKSGPEPKPLRFYPDALIKRQGPLAKQ